MTPSDLVQGISAIGNLALTIGLLYIEIQRERRDSRREFVLFVKTRFMGAWLKNNKLHTEAKQIADQYPNRIKNILEAYQEFFQELLLSSEKKISSPEDFAATMDKEYKLNWFSMYHRTK